MGKFSDYVDTIKQQTESLREVVSAKSSVDCSKMSIVECTGVIDSLEVTSQEEARYIRPSWYPDIEDIVKSAPDITKEGVIYYAVASALLYANNVIGHFNKLDNQLIGSEPYKWMNGTGCDAYIFSDDVDNNIANANENTLVVGNEVTHTWNLNKDITNTKENYSIRWVVFYTKTLNNINSLRLRGYFSAIEIVAYRGSYNYLLGKSNSNEDFPSGPLLKFVKFCKEITNSTVSGNYMLRDASNLEEVITEKPITMATDSFSRCYSLKRIVHDGVLIKLSSNGTGPFSYSFKMQRYWQIDDLFQVPMSNSPVSVVEKYINMNEEPNNLPSANYVQHFEIPNAKKLSGNILGNTFNNVYGVKIPSSLKTWTGTGTSNLAKVSYFELYDDFNISGLNFTGSYAKSLQWLRDLCIWLKDRTGEETGSMVIGPYNLDNANNIYLTFNPNDKRDIIFDGVTAETSGAISITEFITTQLNWTLS